MERERRLGPRAALASSVASVLKGPSDSIELHHERCVMAERTFHEYLVTLGCVVIFDIKVRIVCRFERYPVWRAARTVADEETQADRCPWDFVFAANHLGGGDCVGESLRLLEGQHP
jgi:hypothetical protein